MTILKYLKRYAIKTPNAIALKNNEQEISYQLLYSQVDAYQNYLKRDYCDLGATVILKLKKKQEWVITFISLMALGCFVVPVPYDMTEYELEQVKKETKTDIVIDFFHKGQVNGGLRDGSWAHNTLGGILHMTSGSTGRPKFCIRSLLNLSYEGESYQSTFQMNSSDTILGLCPIYHSFGLGAALMSVLVSGACLYTLDTFVPRKALKIVLEINITVVILVPIMAKLLCQVQAENDTDIRKIRSVIVGAGVITKELNERFMEKFGVPLLSNYGCTETGGIISRILPFPIHAIGVPMPGVSIKILLESGEAAEVNQAGQLWVKSQGMFAGYFNEKKTSMDREGFYPTGDIVYYDTSGQIYLVGRKKHLINIGGKKVNSDEIEKILSDLPDVRDCVVMGIKGKDDNEKIKAMYVGELSLLEVRKCLEIRLSPYKIPSIIEKVDKIPRNEMGKLLYYKL